MTEKIKRAAARLTNRGDKIIVGFSGGADSVCLLHALCALSDELGLKISAAHVNHGLRGDEADRDELFALDFCRRLGIECRIKHADVRSLAEKMGISEETAGRHARYAFFEELSQGRAKIATAHHKNDSAETILMNLFRGSSLAGLAGISEKRGNIIRPLMSLTRLEIEYYCAENSLQFVTDSTNNQSVYTRNRVRHVCIPYIEKYFNSNFVHTVTENAAVIFEENAYLNSETEKLYNQLVKEGEIELKKLHALPLALRRRLVRKICENAGVRDITAQYIEDILLLNGTGKAISLNNDICANISYGKLTIGSRVPQTAPYEYPLYIDEWTDIPEAKIRIRVRRTDNTDKNCFFFPNNAQLCVRNRRSGDIFFPAGMIGRKKIKDYFIDKKIPRSKRASAPLLTCNDEIAWIINMRRDRRFASGAQAYIVETETTAS